MVLLTVSAIAVGCGGGGAGVSKSTTVPAASRPIAMEASEEELLDRYNGFARNLRTLNLTLELKPTTGSKYSGVIDEYHEVKAFLLASRPWNIRMIGQVPIVGTTIFDMASDGQNFEVSIPPKNKFLLGPVSLDRTSSKPIENLRPQHLLDALLWPEIHKEEAVLVEEFNDAEARFYVLTVLHGGYKTEILRRIWFDRSNLQVVRLQAYGSKGALLSDVRYSDWQSINLVNATGTAQGPDPGITEYPRVIRMERTRDEYQLDMTITKMVVNEPLEADRFKLEPPLGAEIVHLGKPDEDKRP
jgi:hypothetical protein